jgi:pSer/pThr/pTyr-binding forkhead associated (FHA) protein
MAKYAFKFLSGKYQGGEFPLPDVGELIIGRAAELDMVLIEDMVSRRHARLVAANGNLTLTDLGSTNGTFVNGEKIKQAKLAVNDRVLVGTSILKLVDASAGASEGTQVDVVPQAGDKPAIAAMMAGLADRPAPSANTMSGDLEEVPLPDLLQLFSTNKKTGSIAIDGPQPARIVLKDGALLQVSLLQNPNIKPMQALCKMLTWTSGAFKFDALKDTSDIPAAFDTSTENALIEAMRLNDESKREAQQLAAGRGKVTLVVPLGPKLTALSKDALEVLQLAINLQEVKKIAAATSDSIATIEQVRDLIGSGYLHLS